MNPFVIVLGVLLAVSAAANAWLLRERDGALEQVATAKQLNADTAAAAQACSASVDALASDTRARSKRLDAMLSHFSGRMLTLQTEANDALRARPSDPKDLCKSIGDYWRAEIRKERAGATR